MGGYGSGRWGDHRKKVTVEDCLVLTVKDLPLDGTEWTEAVLKVEAGEVYHELRAVSTPWHGGRRWWLVCSCGRRVLKVYRLPWGGRLACRTCHGLTYTSSQEAHRFEGLYRAIAANLGLGVTAQEVRRVLLRDYSKRTLRMLDVAVSGGQELARVAEKMKRRTDR